MPSLINLFSVSGGFIPHGHCYLWKPELIGLHVLSDALIALAYYSIPLTLLYFVQKRKDLPFVRVFLLFSAFIVSCGTTHLVEIWTLWYPVYWLSGVIKLLTAIVSVITALMLIPLVPKALTLPNAAELEVANQALQHEINDRLQAEADLQQSEARYRAIVEDQTDLICRFTPDGTLAFVNTAYCRYFDKTHKELLHESYLPVVLEEELAKERGLLGGLSQETPIATITSEVIRPNGVRTQQWVVRGMFNQQGQITEFQAVGRDITELKRTEQALRESEARFQAFMTHSPLAAWIVDANGRMLYTNPVYLHTRHNFAEEIVGKTIFDLYPADIANHYFETTHQVIETNQVFEEIDVALRKNGSVDKFLVYKFPISGVAKQTLVGGIAIDITDRERTKEQLKSLSDRLQYLLTNAPVAIFSCKVDGDYGATSISENIKGILGYESREILEDSGFWLNHLHPEDRDQLVADLAQIFETEQHAREYRILHADGNYRWVYEQLQLMRNEAGEPVEIIGYLVGISDRKHAERALQEREAFLRAIGDNIPNGYLYQLAREQDGCYHFTYVSAGVERLSGLKPEEILVNPDLLFNLLVEEDRAYLLQKKEESAQNLSVLDIQARQRLPNGEVRWLRLCSTPRKLKDGRVIWDGIRLDIDDLKHTEESLRQNEERWQLAVSGSNDGIWDHDLRTDQHYLSPRCMEILGYSYDDINTFDKLVQLVLPEDIDTLRSTFQAHVEHRLPKYACEYRIRCKDGSYKWLLARGQALWDEKGNPIRAVGSVTDISDRKQAEDALRQSEATNRAMLAAIPDLLLRVKRDGICLDFIPPTDPNAGTFLPVSYHLSEALPPIYFSISYSAWSSR